MPSQYTSRPKEVRLVIFAIPGNFGAFTQLPPVFNTIDNYTDILNEGQSEIYYSTIQYGFEFKEQPGAYSQAMIRD